MVNVLMVSAHLQHVMVVPAQPMVDLLRIHVMVFAALKTRNARMEHVFQRIHALAFNAQRAESARMDNAYVLVTQKMMMTMMVAEETRLSSAIRTARERDTISVSAITQFLLTRSMVTRSATARSVAKA
jgi:hypothetical protein